MESSCDALRPSSLVCARPAQEPGQPEAQEPGRQPWLSDERGNLWQARHHLRGSPFQGVRSVRRTESHQVRSCPSFTFELYPRISRHRTRMGSSSRRRQKTSTSSTSRGRRSASTSSRPSTPSSSRRCAAGFTHSSEARCALVSVLRSMRSSLASSLVGALASVTHTHLHARAHPRTRYCSLSLTDTRLAHTSLCMHCAHTRYLHLHLQARTHTCSRRTGGERPADLEALDGGPVPRVCKVQGQRRRLGRLPLDDPRHQEAGEQRVNCNRRREPCSTCSTCLPCSICSICSAYILLLTSFFAHLTSCSPHLTARLTSCSPHLVLSHRSRCA